MTNGEWTGGPFIKTDLTYANSARVVVFIDAGPDGYFLSDHGQGYDDALMIGSQRHFVKAAGKIGMRGAGFDGRSLFVIVKDPAMIETCAAHLALICREVVNTAAEASL
jgi:hypothetical protein